MKVCFLPSSPVKIGRWNFVSEQIVVSYLVLAEDELSSERTRPQKKKLDYLIESMKQGILPVFWPEFSVK